MRNTPENEVQKQDKNYRILTEVRDTVPGICVEKDGICFSCESTEGQPVLLLYHVGEETPVLEIPFPGQCSADSIYRMKVRLPGRESYEYNYRIGGQIVTDPYAPCICGREQFGKRMTSGETVRQSTAEDHILQPKGRLQEPEREQREVSGVKSAGEKPVFRLRGGILRRAYDWKGDRLPQIPWEDVVMYQLHVRGFTMEQHSGVRHRGTFRGLQEKLPYLKKLGVNQLRLMPCYEFDEWMEQPPAGVTEGDSRSKSREPRLNYWGYGNAYYFAPKASYASDPKRTPEELKDLVRACHQMGIEMILEFCFDDRVDGAAVIRCLTYWAEEYHIDGFAVIARDSILTELARLPLFAGRKLIATWYPAETLAHRSNQSRRMLAESNDGFKNDCRRLLKGEEDCLNAFSWRIRQNPKDHAVINYITNHDGFTMADLVSYDRKHNEANGEQGQDGTDYNYSWNCGFEGPATKKSIRQLRLQQMKNAFAMVLLSQGTPMLLAGDEFVNSQQGNNNPYCHDSELTWTDWSRKRSNRELTDFVRELTAFRRSHQILHMERELCCMDTHSCGYPDLSFHSSNAWYGAFEPMNRHLGCMYDSSYAGEDGFLYIAYNFHWESHDFALPSLPKQMSWRKVMDTSKKESFIAFDEQEIYEQEKSFEVSPRTVVILEAGKREGGIAEQSISSADTGKNQRTL